MITVENREAIRGAYYPENKCIRQIAREHSHARRTVAKASTETSTQPDTRTTARRTGGLVRSHRYHWWCSANRTVFCDAFVLLKTNVCHDVSFAKPGKLSVCACTSVQPLWRCACSYQL